MYSLIETAKLNGSNPQHYLADILARIALPSSPAHRRTLALVLATSTFRSPQGLTRRPRRALTTNVELTANETPD
jgi:hypothetical protein